LRHRPLCAATQNSFFAPRMMVERGGSLLEVAVRIGADHDFRIISQPVFLVFVFLVFVVNLFPKINALG
jgi:hypothetical protein